MEAVADAANTAAVPVTTVMLLVAVAKNRMVVRIP